LNYLFGFYIIHPSFGFIYIGWGFLGELYVLFFRNFRYPYLFISFDVILVCFF